MFADPEVGKHVRLAHLNHYFYFRKRDIVKLLLGYFWPGPLLGAYVPGYNSLCSWLESLEYTPAERNILRRTAHYGFDPHGGGQLAYTMMHMTKPLTIGYALNDNPVGLLSYIGEKFFGWSGGDDGVDVDLLIWDLIDNVSIYYLTRSFHTSVLVYKMFVEDSKSMAGTHHKWAVAHNTKLGYSLFPYEMHGATRSTFKSIGDLVLYSEHTSGGHFASLDNPTGLVNDIRKMAAHW